MSKIISPEERVEKYMIYKLTVDDNDFGASSPEEFSDKLSLWNITNMPELLHSVLNMRGKVISVII